MGWILKSVVEMRYRVEVGVIIDKSSIDHDSRGRIVMAYNSI